MNALWPAACALSIITTENASISTVFDAFMVVNPLITAVIDALTVMKQLTSAQSSGSIATLIDANTTAIASIALASQLIQSVSDKGDHRSTRGLNPLGMNHERNFRPPPRKFPTHEETAKATRRSAEG